MLVGAQEALVVQVSKDNMKKRNKKDWEPIRSGSHVVVGEIKPLKDLESKIYVSTTAPNDPIINEEELSVIKDFFNNNPELKGSKSENLPIEAQKTIEEDNLTIKYTSYSYDPDEPWIQTHSGIRFTPLNANVRMINILDIAHALSMICRFNGHCKSFYSVAQHCVLVSYLCNKENSLWGLLHDSPEFALCDLSTPLKHSGRLEYYKEAESNLMKVICQAFGLSEIEPPDVKEADKTMLYTEERELFNIHRSDWNKGESVPFAIKPLPPQEAKDLFMKRFYELTGTPETYYNHYLHYEYNDINKV
jgi:hypothetical protein